MLTATPLFRTPTAEEVARHMPVVRQIVARFLRRLPTSVLRDDLMAAGVYGLVDSLRKNGGDEGPAFETYVRIRVRGAILDELRAQDWLPRRVRWAATKGDAIQPAVSVVCMDDLHPSERAIADERADDAEAMLVGEAEAREIAAFVQELPDRERTILELHYFKGVRFNDISALLGVSEPRISQLHTRALGRLRKRLAEREAA